MPAKVARPLAAALGFGLVALGGGKLQGLDWALRPLMALGLPARLFEAVGWGEILLGVLLAHIPWQRFGGALGAAWMLGAAALHLRAGDIPGAVVASALFLFVLFVALDARRVEWSFRRDLPAPLASPPGSALHALPFLFSRIGPAFMFRWAVGGWLYWLALPLIGLGHAHRERSDRLGRLRYTILYTLFFGFGVGGLWNFTAHYFLADQVAAAIGWAPGSPFQHELAFFHLGSGIVGLASLWWRDRLWWAVALAPGVFTWGASWVHLRDYLANDNVQAGNWSFTVVGGNLIIPAVVIALLFVYERWGGFGGSPERSSAPR